MNRQVENFITTALWSTLDYDHGAGNPPLDETYTIDDINPEFLKECDAFIDKFLELATPLFTDKELEHSPIEHDLWLTCEGHGAGFWDGDYEQGDALTEIVKTLCPYDSYWSDKLNENIKRGSNDQD